MNEVPLDGRSASRLRRREAIVAAGHQLAITAGPEGFSFEDVAAAVGVSRRTVFNHFDTMDALLVAICEDVLVEVTNTVRHQLAQRLAGLADISSQPGTEMQRHVTDALIDAICEAELLPAICTIVSVLGPPGEELPPTRDISHASLASLGELLVGEARSHLSGQVMAQLSLTMALLMAGVGHLAQAWAIQHLATITPESQAAWMDSMAVLRTHIRHGAHSVPADATPQKGK